MGRAKNGMTFNRHAEVGAELYRIRERLVQISVEVGGAYPLAGVPGRPARQMHKAIAAIDQARSDLENRMLDEHPVDGTVYVYYPGALQEK